MVSTLWVRVGGGGEQGVYLEELQNHENVDIYKLAYEIIEQYFSDEVSSVLDPYSIYIAVLCNLKGPVCSPQ